MDFCLLIISGPTASGKTELSEKVADIFSSEIINADVGQFYTPFCVGTAKPDWKNKKVPHNLFDIIDVPKDLTVFEYRKLVLDKAKEIWEKKKLPIVVGGSLFYLKSLYFPPQKTHIINNDNNIEKWIKEGKNLWDILNKIDSKRAGELHPNDIYRITRALKIWLETGKKPSEYKPEYDPKFNSIFIFMFPKKTTLDNRINKRTIEMIKKDGWLKETKNIMGTKWEDFLKNKSLIGYPEIIEWIKKGEKKEEVNNLIQDISCKTRQYAKRQKTFWKTFKQSLQANERKSHFKCEIIEIEKIDEKIFLILKKHFEKSFDL